MQLVFQGIFLNPVVQFMMVGVMMGAEQLQ